MPGSPKVLWAKSPAPRKGWKKIIGCEFHPVRCYSYIRMSTRHSAAPGETGTSTSPSSVSKQAIVDSYGEVSTDLARLDAEHHFTAKKKQQENLREAILSWHTLLPGAEEAIEPGSKWDVVVTPRDNQRVITMAGKRKLYKLWGVGKFLEACGLLLKQLPDPKDAKGLYTVQEPVGPRHLKAIPRLAEAA